MNHLLRLENWIEQLVEEPFVRLFAGRLLPQEVAAHLVQALEDGERLGPDGVPEVPGCYRITLHPDDLHALQTHHPNLAEQLSAALTTLASRIHLRLREPATILLEADASLPPRAVAINRANGQFVDHERTRDLDLSQLEAALSQQHHPTRPAYLIIQGTRTFDLAQDIVRIGRALDNDLVLEEPQVSRYHAQLRCRYGRHVLHNLSSSGTQVNGFLVQEIALRAGDIITLGGLDLIYAEGHEGTPEAGETQPYPTQEP